METGRAVSYRQRFIPLFAATVGLSTPPNIWVYRVVCRQSRAVIRFRTEENRMSLLSLQYAGTIVQPDKICYRSLSLVSISIKYVSIPNEV